MRIKLTKLKFILVVITLFRLNIYTIYFTIVILLNVIFGAAFAFFTCTAFLDITLFFQSLLYEQFLLQYVFLFYGKGLCDTDRTPLLNPSMHTYNMREYEER